MAATKAQARSSEIGVAEVASLMVKAPACGRRATRPGPAGAFSDVMDAIDDKLERRAQRVWNRARRWVADTLRVAAETIDS